MTQIGLRDDDTPVVAADYDHLGGDATPLPRVLAKWIDGFGCEEVTIRTDGVSSICEPTARRLRSQRSSRKGHPHNWRPREDDEGCCVKKVRLLVVPPARVSWRGWCTMPPRCSLGLEKVNKFNPRCVQVPQVISLHRGGL